MAVEAYEGTPILPRFVDAPARLLIGAPDDGIVVDVDGQVESGQGSWMLQSMMEVQKTQGQLVEAVQALREGQRDTQARVETLSREVGAMGQKVHAAQTVVWVVGAGLAGIVGVAGWAITNAIAVLPAVLNAK
jgi:hypothetical protein